MVTTHQNGREMLHPVPHPDELQDISELNELFLILLQGRARQGVDCLGLAAPIARRIRDARPAVIRGLSEFPRALCALNLDALEREVGVVEEPAESLSQARKALTLTVLLTAWNMSRRRRFQARMFLSLSAHDAVLLRTLSLSELHRVAQVPGLLGCAFPDAEKLWASLLDHAEGGLPPALRLVALQPRSIEVADREEHAGARFESASA